jgi:putative SOS response-associated peptidase YedK
MCGRYASHTPLRETARLFHILGPLPNFPPTWNLAPTQLAPVVRRRGGDEDGRDREMLLDRTENPVTTGVTTTRGSIFDRREVGARVSMLHPSHN